MKGMKVYPPLYNHASVSWSDPEVKSDVIAAQADKTYCSDNLLDKQEDQLPDLIYEAEMEDVWCGRPLVGPEAAMGNHMREFHEVVNQEIGFNCLQDIGHIKLQG